MQVKDLMTKVVKVVTTEQSLLEIRELMLNNNLRRIPVVDGDGHLKGIVTDGDVSRATPSDASTLDRYEANYILGKLKAKDLMTKAVITVKAEDGVETAAYLMYKFKIGALPVVDATNKVVGIISDTDVFKAFVICWVMPRRPPRSLWIPRIRWVSWPNWRKSSKPGRKHHFCGNPENRAQTGRHYGTGRSDQCHGHHPDHPGCRFVITDISTLKVDDAHEE